MRKCHRYLVPITLILGLFIAITGLLVQSMDIASELRAAPADDPTMLGRRAGLYGPPNFVVIDVPDYAASNLPGGFDYSAAAANAIQATDPAKPLGFVQFRMAGSTPVVQLGQGKELVTLDPASGKEIEPRGEVKIKPISTPSVRNTIKDIHRMRWFGKWGVAFDLLAGLTMCAMIFTGLALYVQLWRARAKMDRRSPYWFGGNWWRTLHRAASVSFGLFLTVIALSGCVLATSSIGVVVNSILDGKRDQITKDLSTPMSAADMRAMLKATLDAWHRDHPDTAVRVLRLRYFAGMPQGVVVTGEKVPDQIVYNTATGQRVSLTEPNYPHPGQTFGWQADETFKKIHRGDAFGLPGMVISLLSGVALLYLTVSGFVMYLDLWRRRRKAGKHGLFWP